MQGSDGKDCDGKETTSSQKPCRFHVDRESNPINGLKSGVFFLDCCISSACEASCLSDYSGYLNFMYIMYGVRILLVQP